MVVRIGTRGSALALAQSGWVRDRLRYGHPDIEVELRVIKTSGDRFIDTPLANIGGKGVFTKEIEDAAEYSVQGVGTVYIKKQRDGGAPRGTPRAGATRSASRRRSTPPATSPRCRTTPPLMFWCPPRRWAMPRA